MIYGAQCFQSSSVYCFIEKQRRRPYSKWVKQRKICFYMLFCSLFCECDSFLCKKALPKVVNLDDAWKCGWKRLEWFGESVTNISNYWDTRRRERKLKIHRASLAKSYFIQFNLHWNSRLKVLEAVFTLVQTRLFRWRLVGIMCL